MPKVVTVFNCASCRENHDPIAINILEVRKQLGGKGYSFSYTCPNTKELVYIRVNGKGKYEGRVAS